MFDLGRISEAIGGLFGNVANDQLSENGGGIIEILRNHGIDPGTLAGLDPTQVQQFLESAGIDVSTLPLGELSGLIELGNGDAGGPDLGAIIDVISQVRDGR